MPASTVAPSLWTSLQADVRRWMREQGKFFAASFAGHSLALALFAVVAGTIEPPAPEGEAPEFESAVDTALPEPELSRFEVGETPLEPTVLDTASLLELEAPQIEQTEQYNDDSAIFEEAGGGSTALATLNTGGLGGFETALTADGPSLRALGGVGGGVGSGGPGTGGAGTGFGGRGSGMRKALSGAFGGTKQTDRAVAGTVNWLARHQNPDGSWSLHGFHQNCTDPSCREGHAAEVIQSDAAATALALLPFLAAGQTHESRGPYQKTIDGGLTWLISHQKPDGDLSAGSGHQMYTHGLAAIVLCEAYGLTNDRRIGAAAQRALDFIMTNQNASGGWRYTAASTDADTSVLGWQMMALKSGQMAGLEVKADTLERALAFLDKTASGEHKGLFGYEPGGGATPTMTAVGLLCLQYAGAQRDDPRMIEGQAYLMQNLPAPGGHNSYYWYYATQVMHNLPGPEWDRWNREARRVLVETQVKEGCASGSWNPAPDPWGASGGRIMSTAIGVLSMQVYYRYIPLYKLNDPDAAGLVSDKIGAK